MELQIEGRHFKVTEAMHRHVEEKIGKLEKYFDGIHRMHVILGLEKTRHCAELVCTVAKRHTLVARGEAEDMYVAIDKAEKKILAEMKKYKAKLRSISRGLKTGEALGTMAPAEVMEEESAED